MNIIKCGCKGWKNSVNEEEKGNADRMAHADDIKVWMRVRNKQVKMRSNIKKRGKKKFDASQRKIHGGTREKTKKRSSGGVGWLARLLASNMILSLFPTPQSQKYPCTRYNIYCFAHDRRILRTQGRRYRR
jgi:hypothetical protein